jgi:hypothetical protein
MAAESVALAVIQVFRESGSKCSVQSTQVFHYLKMWRGVLIQGIAVNIRFLPNIFEARAGNGFLRLANPITPNTAHNTPKLCW